MQIDKSQSMIVADRVLKALRKKLQRVKFPCAYADLRPYMNGREQGYAVTLVISKGKDLVRRTVVFSENRNSDSIVVYKHRDWYRGRLIEDMYKNREMFSTPEEAAEHCAKFLKEKV